MYFLVYHARVRISKTSQRLFTKIGGEPIYRESIRSDFLIIHQQRSVLELDDYLSRPEKDVLAQANTSEQPLVEYRFDAEPAALHMAIPRTYHGALFEQWTAKAQPHSGVQQ